MRIALLTFGSLGDVQPFVALGVGLSRAGHQVRLVTGSNFAEFVTRHGLDYGPVRMDIFELLQSNEGKEFLAAGWLGKLKIIRQTLPPIVQRMLEDSWTAARDAELVIYHPNAIAGSHIAEKLGIPSFASIYLPYLSPTREFPHPSFHAGLPLGKLFNRASYGWVRPFASYFSRVVTRWRGETLGLPSRRRGDTGQPGNAPVPVLYSFSPRVIPPPVDWDDSVAVTGFWFLESAKDWKPVPELTAFLATGPPPVYVGFGSMTSQDPTRLTAQVVEALRKCGRRGLIATGWGALSAIADAPDVLAVDAVPHDWLFPQVAVVVHHGGAGTTAAGLRAGTPNVICPFAFDQPYWGKVVHDLGVGPRPVLQKGLSTDTLAAAIRQAATDLDMRGRAAALGRKIRAEDGVARAVEIVSRIASGREKGAS